MDEIGFRGWLAGTDKKKKIQMDCISRLRRIERELRIDLDQKYKETQLEDVLAAFSKKGVNDEMKKYGKVYFPIGKSYMGTYRTALRDYIKYISEKK